jgi:hypothetical protein
MYNQGDQRQNAEARLSSVPGAAVRPARRSQNLAPTGSFWRRFQEWERAERAAVSRPVGVAC